MGIIVNNNEEKSELQRKITAELRAKQIEKAKLVEDVKKNEKRKILKNASDIENSEYLKDLEISRTPGWIWGFLVVAASIIFWMLLR